MTQLGKLPIVTELTITEPGWYWFEPQYPGAGGPTKGSFVSVDAETIEEKALHCRRYAGRYAGPIEPPDMSCRHYGPVIARGMFNNTHKCDACGEEYFVAD